MGRVSVNSVSGSTTVVYDPGKTNLAEIQAAIKECGFHCAGEALPKHVCQDHSISYKSRLAFTGSKISPASSHEHAGHDGTEVAKNLAGATPSHDVHDGKQGDAMAHEMGHGAGQDMQGMALDMRNRFLIALGFTMPIFFLSPMGMDSIKITRNCPGPAGRCGNRLR